MIYSGIGGSLEDLKDAAERTIEALNRAADRFDFIAVTGMSGVLIGAPASFGTGKPLVIVRKPSDNDNHSSGEVVGKPAGRYIFVDDFISSGTTKRRVISALDNHARFDSLEAVEHVGDYTYDDFCGDAAGLRWAYDVAPVLRPVFPTAGDDDCIDVGYTRPVDDFSITSISFA